MGILSAVARGARRAGRGVIRRSNETADLLDALRNYAVITGGIGALGGGVMSAADVQSRGGTQDDINEAGYYGGRAGAVAGPLTMGPALAGTMALGPVGASPIVPGVLMTGSEGSRRFDERERRRREREAELRAIEMQMREMHR